MFCGENGWKVIVYVDEMLVLGRNIDVEQFHENLSRTVDIKFIGRLDAEGSKVKYLGKELTKVAGGYELTGGAPLI